MSSDAPALAETTGRLGRIILNRPHAINALTAEMVGIVQRALDRWAGAEEIRSVLLTGAGERGLCAGGDIRAIHADAVAGGSGSLTFWKDEYRLDAAIAAYPKPFVAWMDGLVMGGGIGLAGHAPIRVVTERSRLAMPEVGIGFHPDVGGAWLLARAPGQVGLHLALTGGAIGAGDAIYAGLADHYLPAHRLPALVVALAGGDAAEAGGEAPEAGAAKAGGDAGEAGAAKAGGDAAEAVAALAVAPPAGELAAAREWIDECYAADTVAEILDRLAGHPAAGAQAAAKEIAAKSPTSLAVTLRSLRTAARLPSLVAVLEQDYRLSAALLRAPDLAEGIRAQIIDKDRNPRWQPVPDAATVARYFAPTADDLDLNRG